MLSFYNSLTNVIALNYNNVDYLETNNNIPLRDGDDGGDGGDGTLRFSSDRLNNGLTGEPKFALDVDVSTEHPYFSVLSV